MFDPSKRIELVVPTVEELIDTLQKLPPEATVTCCGEESFWLHVETDGSAVCIDHDELDDAYDDQEDNDGEED